MFQGHMWVIAGVSDSADYRTCLSLQKVLWDGAVCRRRAAAESLSRHCTQGLLHTHPQGLGVICQGTSMDEADENAFTSSWLFLGCNS